MHKIRVRSALVVWLFATGAGLAAATTAFAAGEEQESPREEARFAHVFSDHMVLQRKQPVRVWGRAPAHTELTVSLGDGSKTAKADAAGNWQLDFPAMPAGGPHTLKLYDTSGLKQSVSDVLIGDVWLCSGQSNMEVAVGAVNQSHAQPLRIPGNIRLMTVAKQSRVTPQPDFAIAPGWAIADSESIPGFSAVCYLLAYELQKTLDIPLGMIKSSWGGAGIKTWIGARELRRTGSYGEELSWLKTYATDKERANAQFGKAWEDWWGQVAPAHGQPWREPAFETSGWTTSPAKMGNWKEFGDPALSNHHGMVWFRKSFELSSSQAESGAVLALGGIDEVDYLWVNGHFIGSTFGYGTNRYYDIPRGVLRAGANSVTVNVLNTWAAGGMVGPNDQVELTFSESPSLPLGDGWSYRKIPAEVPAPPRAPWEELGGLTGLSNAMISPLDGLKLAGAIWYQGESDVGNPAPYAELLTALTADWRGRFGAALPILLVQLPNFGKQPSVPAESGWAAIRDAQRRVANAHPNTGLVVTVDAGDANDLHPEDKRVIGRRAANVAKVLAYGQPGIPDGLSPAAVYWQGDSVVLDFDPEVDALLVSSASAPVAFELCGESGGSCVYAESRIEGNRVFLNASAQRKATRVRHCWADAPLCNLYGASGLPVSSFEVDITTDSIR